ncbi:hypothetical protein QQP08_018893 [Theobroma cacao]|nr:hypothetical protein QQP08_018893 [Theobroma cacao]
MNTEHTTEAVEHRNGEYALIRDAEDPQLGLYDKPLPCFGCGIGWFSLLLGFVFPLMWYYATILYFGNYYHKDPRERAGLAASAIAVSANLGIDVLFDSMITFSSVQGIDMYNCCDNHNSCSCILVLATAICIFTSTEGASSNIRWDDDM